MSDVQKMWQKVAATSNHPADMDDDRKAGIRAMCARRVPLGAYVDDYAGGDEDFGLWLALVDLRLTRRTFLGHRDLPDRDYHGQYDAGTDPIDYADEVAEEEFPELG